MRSYLTSFLEIYGDPAVAEVDLWVAALEPVRGDLVEALAAWLRMREQKPQPIEIIRIMQEHESPVSMRRIALDAALKYQISYEDIIGEKRQKCHTHPRQEAMFKMRSEGFTYEEIGRFFGRDHTTVIHSVDVHKARQVA